MGDRVVFLGGMGPHPPPKNPSKDFGLTHGKLRSHGGVAESGTSCFKALKFFCLKQDDSAVRSQNAIFCGSKRRSCCCSTPPPPFRLRGVAHDDLCFAAFSRMGTTPPTPQGLPAMLCWSRTHAPQAHGNMCFEMAIWFGDGGWGHIGCMALPPDISPPDPHPTASKERRARMGQSFRPRDVAARRRSL